MINQTIHESRDIPVVLETDLCIAGGSCTGVFAAVRAARLGLRVALVEKQNCFGGMLTAGLVHYWHSLQDTEYRRHIIGGLTSEFLDRLKIRDAVQYIPNTINAYKLNTEEAKIELDNLARENGIIPFLHTFFCEPIVKNGRMDAVIVENKSGRQAIRSKLFIDATGDGDLAFRAGVRCRVTERIQPPTTCARIQGTQTMKDEAIRRLYHDHREEFGLEKDWGWRSALPGTADVLLHAETHVFGRNMADAGDLTFGEMEGRRQVRAFMDLMRKYARPRLSLNLLALAATIGIRQTRQFECLHTLTESEILNGARFDDGIGNGSYRVDIHDSVNGEIILRYLNGIEERNLALGTTKGRWRPEQPDNPAYYQIPWRSMLPKQGPDNLILAGRMMDTDAGAYGAVRVMVNCNQTGEAAGVGAFLALREKNGFKGVDPALLRRQLAEGGSIVL